MEEDLEAARVEAEKPKYMFQQPPTVPPPALRKSLDKGKQPQFQGYKQKSGDRNQPPTKDKSQKPTQKENPSQDSRSIGKSRTEAGKKAERTKSPSDDHADDDPDTEGSDAGRDTDCERVCYKWACRQLPICRTYWKTACRSSYLPVLLPLVTKTMSQP